MKRYNSQYDEELRQLYSRYKKKAATVECFESAINLAVDLQKEMEELNITFKLWNSEQGYDHDSIYYSASFVVENCALPLIIDLDAQDEERRKQRFASIVFQNIDKRNKKYVHIIEPHPDDAFGSASGLCYSPEAVVRLHTICRVNDERKSVRVERGALAQYEKVRRMPNIEMQFRYEAEDYDYRDRNQDITLEYEKLIQEYREKYRDRLPVLTEAIQSIVEAAKKDDAYLAFPMGTEHPMHMLTTSVCIEQIIQQEFDRSKIIIYIDHPYDFHAVGTGRILKMKEFLQQALNLELCRCDDRTIDQAQIGAIIKEIYGEKHYGEFDGALENTFCSYLVNCEAVKQIQSFLNIHVNNILFITAQAKPYWKTGGQGEVVYTLCKTLKDFVNDVRILMPKYSEDGYLDTPLECTPFTYLGSCPEIGDVACSIEKRLYDGLTYYLLEMEGYFGKDAALNAGCHGKSYAIFCDAILQKGLNNIDYVPSVLHCHDWQTALLPMLKKIKYPQLRPRLKVAYTIHFYGYKGIFKKDRILKYVGLDRAQCRLCVYCGEDCPLNRIDLLSPTAQNELNVTPSQMSFMKAGIEFADVVTTVSEGYAKELQHYPDCTNVQVIGIRNGLAQQRYQFSADSGFEDIHGEALYGLSEDEEKEKVTLLLKAKQHNKILLQRKLGLREDASVPLICMVSRLTAVKGIEVVKCIVQEILAIPAQLVIVGDDDDREGQPYANFFRSLEQCYAGEFAHRNFSEELEFQTYAGADMVLMPSLSEACGTTQMLAMRYGVVPIVSMISAFGDTVLDFKSRNKKVEPRYWGKGIGFYAYKDDCWVLLEVIKKAAAIYRNDEEPGEWKKIMVDCAKVRFGWENGSIRKYLELYNRLAEGSI